MHQRLLGSTWSTLLCILGSFRALWPSDTTCKVLHSKSILSKVNFASVPEISINYPSPLNNYKLLYKYLTAQYKSILRYLPEILNGFSKNADAYDWLTFGRSQSQVKTVIPLFLWSLPLSHSFARTRITYTIAASITTRACTHACYSFTPGLPLYWRNLRHLLHGELALRLYCRFLHQV